MGIQNVFPRGKGPHRAHKCPRDALGCVLRLKFARDPFPRAHLYSTFPPSFFGVSPPFFSLFSSSKSSRPIDERKNDEKRTLACACVFTTRLGATFFRLKELVEPAVDLAKEIDCMEAAIFMRVFRAFLCGLRARARIFSFSPFGDGAVFFLVFFLFDRLLSSHPPPEFFLRLLKGRFSLFSEF
tara:strand:+ start:3379 stop:3930 length:552 start_codon:yes stop_codon:yes gene_type:complete